MTDFLVIAALVALATGCIALVIAVRRCEREIWLASQEHEALGRRVLALSNEVGELRRRLNDMAEHAARLERGKPKFGPKPVQLSP